MGVNVRPLLRSCSSSVVSVKLLKLWMVMVGSAGGGGLGIKNDPLYVF